MKPCIRCGAAKPLTEFYTHPRMADGHLNKCKDCTCSDAAVAYARKMADPVAVDAERARGREKHRRLYSVGKNWQSPASAVEQKRHANIALNNAVRDGRVEKPRACGACGTPGRVQGHHTDYAKPLDVEWLCAKCHRARHATHPERVARSA
jgi:hypothetical protein